MKIHHSRKSLISLLLAMFFVSTVAYGNYSPKVAIVICKDSYTYNEEYRQQTEMSSMAFVGLAGLVGVPYETKTLSELIGSQPTAYSNIWMSYCPVLGDANHTAIKSYLNSYRNAGGSIIIDGHFGFFDLEGNDRGVDRTLRSLGLDYFGFINPATFSGPATVKVANITHPIIENADVELNAPISSVITGGIHSIHNLDPLGKTLLNFGGDTEVGAFLTVIETTPTAGAVVGLSSFASFSGLASPVIGSDADYTVSSSKVMSVLVETALWSLNGGKNGVTAGLQISHGDLTMIARLDGDQSDLNTPTTTTLDYLSEVTEGHGLNTLYAVTTNFNNHDAQWDTIRKYASGIQRDGGVIGSHSASHPFNMSLEMQDSADWARETTESISTVFTELGTVGKAPPLKLFINPGGGIKLVHFDYAAKASDLFLTQNYELSVPYATGVMQWSLADSATTAVPVVYTSPVPDFRSLYLGQRNAADVVNAQKEILNYYRDDIGRGVIYNHMWHDYTIQEAFNDKPEFLPLFEEHMSFIDSNNVYLPAGKELQGKMWIANSATFNSSHNSLLNKVTVNVDLSSVAAEHRTSLVGMGLKINNGNQAIASVQINGDDHFGFNSDTVILPKIESTTTSLQLQIALGEPLVSHVTFVSKSMSNITRSGSQILLMPERLDIVTRFCVNLVSANDTIVIGGTEFKPNRIGEYCDLFSANSNPVSSTFFNVDGQLTEWADLPSYPEDPDDMVGVDANGAQANWKNINIAHNVDTDMLYMAYTNQTNIFISWGFQVLIDTDNNPDTGLSVFAGKQLPIGADYMIEGVLPYRYTGSGGDDFTWTRSENAAGYEVGRIWTGHTGEVFLPLSWIGNPSSFSFIVFGNNNYYVEPNTDEYDWYPDKAPEGEFFRYVVQQ